MTNGFTSESMKELLRLTSWCLNPVREHRPSMSLVETEVHRIREQEIRLTTVMAESSTPIVTLGSQLFTTSR
uniref:Serine-threonine/tyrosine-protein kinase catalytic domain-containing protein n=1 Tax=Arundo donax TaxID=35708 RepID=A0A0A9E4Q0_ARUDO